MGAEEQQNVYYFDNAASSWPKPPSVWIAMQQNLMSAAANPGRGSHRMAVAASRTLFQTRKSIAKLFHISNPNDISFMQNTTAALNQGIKGFLKPGQHVICTSIEHNSVRRPLEYLRRTIGIDVTYLTTAADGAIHLQELRQAIRPSTTLLVCTHSSNLLGSIMPIADISEITKPHGIKLLIDAAQTAGTFPIDVNLLGIDMLAFPGHKGLMGPQGTGGLYIQPDLELEPLLHGGTGSQSEVIEQPNVRPDRYEAGTPNTVGIAGLNEGVKFILHEGVEKIHTKEWTLTQRLMEGLMKTNGITLLGPKLGIDKTGIVSFTLDGIDSSELSFMLDQSFRVAVRAGYHCTPLGHETAGTTQGGAVRASLGYFTTEEEVDYFIHAIEEIKRMY